MSKVSVIMASCNYEQYLKEAIESVIAQTFKDWELIIVDDGSKDNSVELIKLYCSKDSRIKLYQHKNGKNRGLKETVLLGIKNAKSDWIAFLESDDSITPDYLEKKFAVAQKFPHVKFIFNDVYMFGETTESRKKELDKYFGSLYQTLRTKKYPCDMRMESAACAIAPTFSCVMAKKDLLIKLDYNTPVDVCLDYYLWMQALEKTKVYFIDEKLTNWRQHKDSYFCRNINKDDIGWVILNYKRRKIFFRGKHRIVLLLMFLYNLLIRTKFVKNLQGVRYPTAGPVNNKFPLVYIEISGACNAHCPFCVTGCGDIAQGKMMSLDLFKKTVYRLRELELITNDSILALYNWGEPFLNPQINEILEFCTDEKLKIALSTNGSVYKKLSPKAIKSIVQLMFSMSGFTQQSYDKIHGFDVKKIKSNIENFTADFKKYSKTGRIQIKHHIYQWNLDEIPLLAKYADKLGIDYYSYYAFINNYGLLKKYKTGAADKETEKEINTNLFSYYLHNYNNDPNYECTFLWNLVIDEEANVVICCCLAKNIKEYTLCNIFDNDVLSKISQREYTDECRTCLSVGMAQIPCTAGFMPEWVKVIKESTVRKNFIKNLLNFK